MEGIVMMKSILARKILFLVISTLAAMFALSLIQQLIHDRLFYQEEAKRSIANSWSGEQQILGPMLVVPYSYTELESYVDDVTKKSYMTEVEHQGYFYIIPEQIQMESTLTTQERSRGIFSFPVYTAQINIQGNFDLSDLESLMAYGDSVQISTPYLSVALSDIRGLSNRPKLLLQGKEYTFEAGSQLHFSPQGIHASLPDLLENMVTFSFDLNIRGMDTLWFTPIGKNTSINMDALWPHPNFVGKFLPNTHTIEADSFQATWEISEFSSSIIQDMEDVYMNNAHALKQNKFGVHLESPVDIYRQSIRSVKYGILFIGLTFISFFIFEILKKLQIHPVQYTLVSLSLAVFYLLLVAFSEAVGFVLAYIFATIACVSLLTFYVCSILRNLKWGLGFGAFIALLYTILYIILNSEDHALLLGSGLVFIALTLTMVLTRHLDWYQISEKTTEKIKNIKNIEDDKPE